jgi:hypothetical protein
MVTRLGEFSPFDRLFTSGSFVKKEEVAQNILATFLTVKEIHKFDRKMCWATFWAIFITNSSGHPADR